MAWYRWDGNDLLLSLHVQPRASRDEWAGPMGDAYKVRIKAAPVDGKANAHLIRFLAKAFGVTRNQVHLVNGAGARRKTLRIHAPARLPLPAMNSVIVP
jgi:uncharacterized protein (TIGR00251 family)